MSVTSAQPNATSSSVSSTRTKAGVNWRKVWAVVWITLLSTVLLVFFLAPLASMVFNSLKTLSQLAEPGAPIWPALPATFVHEGEELPMYIVPMEDGEQLDLAMVRPGRRQSVFIDPNNLEAGEITWEGNWRGLERDWSFAPTWENYPRA